MWKDSVTILEELSFVLCIFHDMTICFSLYFINKINGNLPLVHAVMLLQLNIFVHFIEKNGLQKKTGSTLFQSMGIQVRNAINTLQVPSKTKSQLNCIQKMNSTVYWCLPSSYRRFHYSDVLVQSDTIFQVLFCDVNMKFWAKVCGLFPWNLQ